MTGSPASVHTLEVVLTAQCNLRCSYCYQNDKQSRRMEWLTLKPALDLVLRSDPPEVKVYFFGGEPLLEMPLIRQTVAYLKERSRPDKQFCYAVSTNGILLDDDSVRFLAKHEFETQLSFDGISAAQDFRGRGTHPKIDALVAHLRSKFPDFYRRKFNIALTLHPGNLTYLADSVAYFLETEVPRFAISPIITHDASWKLENIEEMELQFERIFDLLLDHYESTGDVPFECFQKERSDELDYHRPVRGDMCGVSRGEALAIDVDGQVTGCVSFTESYQRFPNEFLKSRLETMKLGKIRDLEFRRRLALFPEAARAAGMFTDKAAKHSSYQRCAECEYIADCGICPTSIGHIPGNTDPNRVPDFACAFFLTSLKYRAKFPDQPSIEDLVAGRAPLPKLIQTVVGRKRSAPRGKSRRQAKRVQS